MTFYNVISGILFLAACQTLLAALGTPPMWLAAVLMVTILNESILTSELIERKSDPVQYTIYLKLLDFLTFIVLSWALLVLNSASNIFNVDVHATLLGANNARAFWCLLLVYWLLTLLWNHIAGQRTRTKWKRWFYLWMHSMWLLPLVALLVNRDNSVLSAQAPWTVYVNLVIVSSYLFSKGKAPA